MIEEVKRKKGMAFRAVVYGPGGIRKRKTFSSKTLAKEWERRMFRERDEQEATGLFIQEAGNFEDFSQRWLKEKVGVRCSSSTQVSYARILRMHLNPLFGKLQLKDVRVEHANRLVGKLKSEGYAPKGINYILGVMLTMLNDAVHWQVLSRNPLFRYRPVKEPEVLFDYWTQPEIRQFLNATLNDAFHDVYVFALNTGMRRGEICALKWDRVDFINGQIVVSRTLDRYGLSETTKSGRKRIVPISPVVRRMLERRMRLQRGEFVFSDGDGEPMPAHYLSRIFQRSQKRAGFAKAIRFHDLRHTFASHFMMNGGNIYDLQKILGHASLEMTQRYAHMSPAHLAQAIQIVSFSSDAEKNVVSLDEARKEKTLLVSSEIIPKRITLF